MGLLIKNGEIVTSGQRYKGDIWCEGETITRIGANLDAPPDAKVIDASGRYVFPGFIDPHVHVYLPFMGTYARDDYESGSRAALVGGTTSFIDFVIPGRDEEPLAALATWNEQSEGKSSCDYAFHQAVTRFDSRAESQIREIVAGGITSFKVFLAYKGALGVEDDELYGTLKLAKELGVLTAAHCENACMVDALQGEAIAAGHCGPEHHHDSRPPAVEADGTAHLMKFAQLTGAHVYVAHCSCEEALRTALMAKHQGINAWVETVIQFLLLDKSYSQRDGFEAAKYVMSPPLRDKEHQQYLWNGLRHGLVSTVATDHAPFDFAKQKPMGKDDFRKIPNGIPAIEDRPRLLYTYGVSQGLLDIHRFVDVASTQAAKLFGLFPRKGTIQPGADADLVIWDPSFEGTFSVKHQQQAVDYNAFEGWKFKGRPDTVTVRGQVQVEGAKFVGTKGHGKRIDREPTHF